MLLWDAIKFAVGAGMALAGTVLRGIRAVASKLVSAIEPFRRRSSLQFLDVTGVVRGCSDVDQTGAESPLSRGGDPARACEVVRPRRTTAAAS